MDQSDNVTNPLELINYTEQEIGEESTDESSNLKILYITCVIIVGLLSIWIITMIFTKDDVKILNEMLDTDAQTKPIIDTIRSTVDTIKPDSIKL